MHREDVKMNTFEKERMDGLDEAYRELLRAYEGMSALHAANLVLGSGKDEKKTLEHVIRIIQTATEMLHVMPGKVKAVSGMPKNQIVKWTPHSETIQINIEYLREKKSMEEMRSFLIALIAVVFVRHVRAIAESSNETVREYARKTGWDAEWKHPVDPLENPKRFFEQNYVKDAVAYGIAYAEGALLRAEKALKEGIVK